MTLLEAVQIAEAYGLEVEVVECFDRFVSLGMTEDEAARAALREWDL